MNSVRPWNSIYALTTSHMTPCKGTRASQIIDLRSQYTMLAPGLVSWAWNNDQSQRGSLLDGGRFCNGCCRKWIGNGRGSSSSKKWGREVSLGSQDLVDQVNTCTLWKMPNFLYLSDRLVTAEQFLLPEGSWRLQTPKGCHLTGRPPLKFCLSSLLGTVLDVRISPFFVVLSISAVLWFL